MCDRYPETAGLQVCGRWKDDDSGGSLINIKLRKNGHWQIRVGQELRFGVSSDPELDVNDQLTAFFPVLGYTAALRLGTARAPVLTLT